MYPRVVELRRVLSWVRWLTTSEYNLSGLGREKFLDELAIYNSHRGSGVSFIAYKQIPLHVQHGLNRAMGKDTGLGPSSTYTYNSRKEESTHPHRPLVPAPGP